ncbi:MAG: type II secretion system F family protein [Hyphomicrobiales bacterium]
MFGIPLNVLIIAALVALCAMLLAVAFLLPKLDSEKRTDARLKGIKQVGAGRAAKISERSRQGDQAKRRKNIQETLEEIDQKSSNSQKVSLALRLRRAGLKISKVTFIVLSVVTGMIFALVGFIVKVPLLMIGLLFIVGALGLPRFILSVLAKRRMTAFVNELPDAVDMVVRGIKAGLPLNDGLKMVAGEAKEPLASEFRNVVETQQLGVPMADAIQKISENLPMPETNFLATVISIQQTSGGSLSEALGNLSKILRERKKMKAKIKAISSEAKASAGIIGSLPIVVGTIVYIISPDYIGRLFESSTGHLILGIGFMMMFTGSMVMRKMINFEI